MSEFIGRFHPLLVHLPIGILLLAILFELLPSGTGYKYLKKSIYPILWLGTLSAIFSSLSGYLLSQSGDYESGLVEWHQWMGISLTIYSLGYTWMRKRKGYKSFRKIFAVVLLILITITGHLGGSLTHGEDYLTGAMASEPTVDISKVDLQQAKYYDDLVQPILEARCYGCHGSSKQKGKLRLDAPEHILKGGEDGKVLMAGNVGESDLINRMLLPRDDEDHMPPKEKPQPTAQEIEILKLWIASGADFKKSVVESNQLTAVQKVLSSENVTLKTTADIPEGNVAAAKPETINELVKLEAVILPVANGINYLSVNLINVTELDKAIDLLTQLKEQLVWLKGGGQPLNDNHLVKLGTLTNLTRLNLEGSGISDGGVSHLKSLSGLVYLNLNNTKVTSSGIGQLAALKKLQSLFLYGTGIKAEEVGELKKQLPDTQIETGNYTVPFLPSDTTEAKAPPATK